MSGDNDVQSVEVEAVHIPPNRLLKRNQLLQRLLLVACSYLFLVLFSVSNPILAILAVFSFAASAILSLYSFLGLLASFSASALHSDSNGITDSTGPLPGGLVRWEEISDIREATVDDETVLLFHLRDTEAYLNRLPEPKRSLLSASIPIYGTPCVVSQDDLGIPIAEALRLLEDSRQRFRMVAVKETTPAIATAPTAHWWTAVPPEERKAQPLRNGSGDR